MRRNVGTGAPPRQAGCDPHHGPSPRNLVSVNESPGTEPALSRGLAGYVRAVAAAVGVPPEAASFEVSDTATAYLGLATRWSGRPGDDLMLVWSERHGWAVAVETDPGDAPVVLAYFAGPDVAPEPAAVARFVTDVVTGARSGSASPTPPARVWRQELAGRLAPYS